MARSGTVVNPASSQGRAVGGGQSGAGSREQAGRLATLTTLAAFAAEVVA